MISNKIGNYRWRICALLFFATSLNYLDRSIFSILAPELERIIGWSELEYSYIVSAFQLAYGVSVIGIGKLIDKYGVGKVFPVAVAFWSIASSSHALARSAVGFGLARFGLGIGEGANFPAALKTVTKWFPIQERATAIGIFNAGSSVGAILAPLLVPWITLHYGWKMSFILSGFLGAIWITFWLLIYRRPEHHKKLSPEELAFIKSDNIVEDEAEIPWRRTILKKETLIICLVRFISDPTWWFLLFWLPKFLYKDYGITITDIGPPLIAIYLIADIGSIGWGWFSSRLIKSGRSANFARKLTMLICALCVIPIILVPSVGNLYFAISLISLATASHMGFVGNVYAIISDIFPQKAIGSVTGLSTMSAVIGGLFFSTMVGLILEVTGSYFLIFLIAGFTYFLAWTILSLSIPRLRKIHFESLSN